MTDHRIRDLVDQVSGTYDQLARPSQPPGPPCPDCVGTGITVDVDGSLTGERGALTPCVCVLHSVRPLRLGDMRPFVVGRTDRELLASLRAEHVHVVATVLARPTVPGGEALERSA